MTGKSLGKKLNKMNLFRRLISTVLAAALIFLLVPFENLKFFPQAYAEDDETVFEELLVPLVEKNLGSAAKYSEITEESIASEFKALNPNKKNWSTVNLYNLMDSLGATIKDTYTEVIDEKEYTREVNPWSAKSNSSPGSPYAPGKDFFDNSMNTGYTMGQFMIDYSRNTWSEAALLTDGKIIELYDQAAGAPSSDDSDPFVKISALRDAIKGEAGRTGIGLPIDNDALGYINTENFVQYGKYLQDRTEPIPAGTLFIGTWLIDAKSLNDTFYHMAVDSMTDANQQLKLYKSELAGSRWKNIYGATGLKDILPLAETVEDTSLFGYYVSIVVGADGIARSAKTGQPVDVFNLSNPYEIEELPELRALKMQFDSKVVSASDSGSKFYIYERLKNFFNADQVYTHDARMKDDCAYVMDIATRDGIAFYAQDYRFWGLRYEESGRGFLESLETAAECGRRPDYDWGGSWSTRLIRGSVSWTNELWWFNEVSRFGGISELRRRFWNFQNVWSHFSCVRDEVTDEYDKKLAGMGDIYTVLRSSGDSSDIELADRVLLLEEKLDAGRRAQVYYNLCENDEANYIIGPSLPLLYEWVSYGSSSLGRNFGVVMHTDEDFSAVSSITEAVEGALTECDNSYIKYSSRKLSQGETIASKLEYELSNTVIDRANFGAAAIRADLESLVDLDNVLKNVIAHKTRELNLINNILETADAKYTQAVHEAAGETYQKAVSDPDTTKETLDEILQDQKADVLAAGVELQRYIKAKSIRLKTDDAIAFIEGRLNWAEARENGISADDFGPYAKEALDEHIKWLKMLLQTIKIGGDIKDEAQELEDQKAELENQYNDALDNGDDALAEELKGKIEDIQKKIDEANNKKNEQAGSPTATAADKANAEQTNTPQAKANDIINDILGDIADGDFDFVESALDALEVLDTPRVSEVVDALKLHGAPAKLIKRAEEIADNVGNGDNSSLYSDDDSGSGNGDGDSGGDGSGGEGTGSGGSGGDGSGDSGGDGLPAPDYGDGSGLNDKDFDRAIKETNGKDYKDLSDADKIAAVASLIEFANARNDDDAYKHALDLLNDLLNSGNPFIYRQYLPDLTREYVSLAAVDKCRRYTRFRLVDEEEDIEESKNQRPTMQQFVQGSASYVFEVGSKNVLKNDGEVDVIDIAPVLQEDSSIRGDAKAKYPYIAEKHSGQYLYCTCVYIPGTEWAVLITPTMDKKIARLLDAFDLEADKTE